MAAAAVSAPQSATEDDEAWLYGDDNKDSKGKGSGASEPHRKKDDREAGELSGEEEAHGKENATTQDSDDDDDSDDDVQVTIGDIQTFAMNDASRNIFKTGGYHKPGAGASGASRATTSQGTTRGVDVDAVGTINGVSTYDFDLDGLQADDKPWRKPGADITDYFNYGFNEDTWRQYCDRQRRMRGESGPAGRIYTNIRTIGDPKKDIISNDSIRSVPVLENRRPVTARKTSGTIDVIGSTSRDSRRPEEGDPIPTTGKSYSNPPTITGLPPGVPPPDYSVPPPGLPPPGFPPPGVPLTSVPPPGALPPGYEHFYQPPTTRYDDRGSNYYDSQTYTYTDSHASWENRSSSYRWEGGRDRSPARSESDFSSSGSERGYRYSRDRRYDRDRDRSPYRRDRDRYRDRDRDRSDRDRDRSDRDRDRSDRDRDRDRDKDRYRDKDRDTSRTRDGSPRIKIKEEKDRDRDKDKDRDRRRRKKDDEDSDHHKSKHKKKKIKKEKEDDDQYPPVLTQETPVKQEPA